MVYEMINTEDITQILFSVGPIYTDNLYVIELYC